MTVPWDVEVVQVLGPASVGVVGYFTDYLLVRSIPNSASTEDVKSAKVNTAAVTRTLFNIPKFIGQCCHYFTVSYISVGSWEMSSIHRQRPDQLCDYPLYHKNYYPPLSRPHVPPDPNKKSRAGYSENSSLLMSC